LAFGLPSTIRRIGADHRRDQMISNRVPAHIRLDVIIPFWPDRREATSGHLFAGDCAFAASDFGTLRELIVILRDQAKTSAATQQKSLWL
jgi:hypothetical protein